MKIITTLFRLLFAIYLLAFAGAVVGGFAGLMLAALDLLEFDHVLWLMEAGAALLVVWGFVATSDDSTVELPEPPKPKARAVELFDDDGPFINLCPHGGIWPMCPHSAQDALTLEGRASWQKMRLARRSAWKLSGSTSTRSPAAS